MIKFVTHALSGLNPCPRSDHIETATCSDQNVLIDMDTSPGIWNQRSLRAPKLKGHGVIVIIIRGSMEKIAFVNALRGLQGCDEVMKIASHDLPHLSTIAE